MATSRSFEPLSSNANSQTWKIFKQKFNIHLLAAGFKDKSDEEKVALFLEKEGDHVFNLYNTFEFHAPAEEEAADPSQVLKTVLEKLVITSKR